MVVYLFTVAVGKPQNYNEGIAYESHTKYIPGSDVLAKTLQRDTTKKHDGSYNYRYETSNGISAEESGTGAHSVQGSSQYTSPEGKVISIKYTADENGYHPVGDHIPKIPDYILRALEYIKSHPYKVAGKSGVLKAPVSVGSDQNLNHHHQFPVKQQQHQYRALETRPRPIARQSRLH